MDACAPRRGRSCCPCVSFGFDLASMASGAGVAWSQNPICQAKNSLCGRRKERGYAPEQATLTPGNAALAPHAIDAQRDAGLVPRAASALLECSDQERAHPASAEEPQRHRRVDKSTLCSGHGKKCSRRASSTPRARLEEGGGAACRATGGSSARSGAAPRPRRSAPTSSGHRLHFGKQARHDARRARARRCS